MDTAGLKKTAYQDYLTSLREQLPDVYKRQDKVRRSQAIALPQKSERNGNQNEKKYCGYACCSHDIIHGSMWKQEIR